MIEETQMFKLKESPDSKAFNVSIRAWICLLVVLTVCYMSVAQIEIREPLYTLCGMVIGYYFAQSKKQSPETKA
jgi:hypothetical protein